MDKDSLRTHTIEHSDTKRYPCSYCSKHFGRSNDCKRHEVKCPALTETALKMTPVSKGADINSRKQKSSNLVNVQRHVTHSSQSIAQNTSTDSAKNKQKYSASQVH